MAGRALHFVFKVADRTLSARFYREILGMKVLRHEEFKEGCEAACNGPYDNRWSKTMIGYGPEDRNFVMELTYNYNVDNYSLGNDFVGITIHSREAIARAKVHKWPLKEESGHYIFEAPGGYKFYIKDVPETSDKDPVQKVSLACSNLLNTIAFWSGHLELELYNETEKSALFGFSQDQVQVEFIQTDEPIDHSTAYGRIAFSVPGSKLPVFEKRAKHGGHKILTPLISLDTPGKATVTVLILADPDGHEICFVDDENFRKLSEFDPKGEAMLDRYIEKDKARKEEVKA